MWGRVRKVYGEEWDVPQKAKYHFELHLPEILVYIFSNNNDSLILKLLELDSFSILSKSIFILTYKSNIVKWIENFYFDEKYFQVLGFL